MFQEELRSSKQISQEAAERHAITVHIAESKSPPEPPPEVETITLGRPVEPQPRRARERPPRTLGDDVLLVALCMAGSYLAAFLGNLTASLW